MRLHCPPLYMRGWRFSSPSRPVGGLTMLRFALRSFGRFLRGSADPFALTSLAHRSFAWRGAKRGASGRGGRESGAWAARLARVASRCGEQSLTCSYDGLARGMGECRPGGDEFRGRSATRDDDATPAAGPPAPLCSDININQNDTTSTVRAPHDRRFVPH